MEKSKIPGFDHVGTLENWALVCVNGKTEHSPDIGAGCIQGDVPLPRGGSERMRVCTQPIEGQCEGLLVTIEGHTVELGEVDPKYEEAYPGARDRLFVRMSIIERPVMATLSEREDPDVDPTSPDPSIGQVHSDGTEQPSFTEPSCEEPDGTSRPVSTFETDSD